MRSIAPIRSLLVALSLGTALAFTPACSKKSPVTEESNEKAPEAITEESDDGSIAWSVAPDGQVRATVKSTDDKPIDKNVTGELTWKSSAGEQKIPLTVDGKTGVLVASGPPLSDDLTSVDYTVTVDGKARTGTLHLPRGGTQALADDAREAAKSPVPEGKLGPNGGVIQIVGKDRVEIVADKASGQVRVYVLDADLKVVPIGDRKIKLAISGDSPELVVLVAEPGGRYGTGRMVSRVDPVRLTVAITVKEETHACIVGWSPGARLTVGSRARRVKILVATGFGPPDVDVKVKVQAPSVGVIVVHDDDDDDGHGHGHGNGKGKHGHGGAKINVKIH